jgi:RND family efflux transporter MFP subunit
VQLRTLLVLLSFGLIIGASRCSPAPAPPPPRIAVTVLTVSEAPQSQTGAYTASFQPYRQVSVAAQVGGYIESIKQVRGADGRLRDIQAGDPVKAQELLATVKSDTYQAQVDQFASALAGARASYTKAQRDFDRDSQLLKQQVIAKSEYDQTRQEYESTQSQVEQAEATLSQAQINLGHCRLASPMDGEILDRHAEIGSLVEQGTVAFKVADTSEMKAIFGVSDIQVELLKQGEPQTVVSEAIPGVQLVGTITKIAPNADPTTRIFDVEVTVPNKDGKLRTGMIASLQLVQTEAPRATEATLPLNAIVRPPHDQNDFAVYMVEDRGGRSIARLREVRLGEIVGNDIMVASGVNIGDRVIVRGATMVSEGAEVRIIP